MHRSPPALAAALVAALLAGCPGGGGDDSNDPPPVPATFTVTGTITAAAGQVMDSDTGDARDVPKLRNDTPVTAQVVPSSAMIGGFVGVATDRATGATVLTDERDFFKVRLGAGQAAVLSISTAGADLDLCLYAIAAPPPAAAVECSPGESVRAPVDGEYFVVVSPVVPAEDASNYVLTLGVTASGAPGALRTGAEFVPGEILVRFREDRLGPAGAPAGDELRIRAAALGMEPLGGGVRGRPALLGLGDTASRARALAALGVEPRPPSAPGAPLDALAAEKLDTLRAIEALRRRPDVESADPNYVFRPSAVPPNEYYPLQWHYPLINLPQAWDVNGTSRGTGVVVAVIDTGVVLDHPDFANRAQLVAGYDFIADATRARDGDGRDPDPDDMGDEATLGSSSWHGTHVAGTIAAAWADGQGAAGIAPDARVMPLRALGVGGGSSADIIEALRFAAGLPNASGTVPARRADVINLSLGCLDCFSTTEQAVYREVRSAGVIVVAAAGNENSSLPGYPASYDGVVSVSAVDLSLARAPYSNRGPSVDLAAPGGNAGTDLNRDGYPDGVLSAIADDSSAAAGRRPAWAFYQGTSMSAPHVAGVIALMKSVCPTLGPTEFDDLLAAGTLTRDIGAVGRDDAFGHGLVDALAAVQAASTRCGKPPPAGAQVTPPQLDLGGSAGSATLAVSRTGDPAEPLSVRATTPADAGWLSVTPGNVDANGFGTYAVTVDRTVPDGRYLAAVTFSRATGEPLLEVPVLMQVGAPSGPGDTGYLYVLLLDAEFDAIAQAEPGSGPGGGVYPFSFPGIPAGTYFLVAGTDSDNDDVICDEGEACGMWPTLGLPTSIEVGADLPGRDFGVALDVALGGAMSASASPWAGPTRGFAKLPSPKTAATKEVRP
jgi:serine protease